MAVPVGESRAGAPGLGDYLGALEPDPVRARQVAREIGVQLLANSPSMDSAQFEAIAPGDLWSLFHAYDRRFFAGLLSGTLGADPREHLAMRLSSRMTSAGGKATVYQGLGRHGYEITISSHLLFTNFEQGEAPVPVNGLPCHTRLDALQRIFEHELMHLVELLAWGRSSCRRRRFRVLAHSLFGHTEVTHRLPTVRQRARQQLGLGAGDPVWFQFEGRRLEGFVNRITKRATVLVPDPSGKRYSDGRTYAKYYVPVERLRVG